MYIFYFDGNFFLQPNTSTSERKIFSEAAALGEAYIAAEVRKMR